MKFEIKNIGFIKEANITIDGLTVIAGENDSGKSTIGKLMFSIIKSISRYKEDLEEDREANIKKLVEEIYFFIRRHTSFQRNKELKEVFYYTNFIEDINRNELKAIEKRKKNAKNLNINDTALFMKFDELEEVIKKNYNKNEIIKERFKRIIYSEFKGEVVNKNIQKNEGVYISIREGENDILKIQMRNLNSINFELFDELYFNDTTFIETPMILNFNETIENSKSYFDIRNKEDKLKYLGIPNIAFHIKDIDSKLKQSIYNYDLNENIFNKISNIVNGEIKYIREEREFIYIKRDGQKYKSINTASGIKAFGILQMLLNGGFLDERSILIIDEPEVHLHPKWQLKYAELMVTLVKNGINVLITTHSPYMLEALEKYSKIENISNNFYLAENGYIFEDEDSFSKIFKKLSEPFDEFDKIESEILNG